MGMGWLLASLQCLPFLVGSCVLGGIAVAGWRRTGANGALLVGIACGVRVLHDLVGVYQLDRLFARGRGEGGDARWMALSASVQTGSALTAEVLVIVGVALLVRRLPSARRSAP